LRQCRSDFHPPTIQRLVRTQKAFIAEVDGELRYFERSFCLFEVWSAVEAKCTLLCDTHPRTGAHLTSGARTIDSAAAKSGDPADKAKIDSMIEATIGFEQLDQLLTQTVTACHRRQYGANVALACVHCGSLEHKEYERKADGSLACAAACARRPEVDEDVASSSDKRRSKRPKASQVEVAKPEPAPSAALLPDEHALELHRGDLSVHADYAFNAMAVDHSSNNNKFYRGQVLTAAGSFFLWTRWGRVGEAGQSRLEGFGTAEEAVAAFARRFKDKTGHTWMGMVHADYSASKGPTKYRPFAYM
jgi:predicted DNA-binding WGR domain protein